MNLICGGSLLFRSGILLFYYQVFIAWAHPFPEGDTRRGFPLDARHGLIARTQHADHADAILIGPSKSFSQATTSDLPANSPSSIHGLEKVQPHLENRAGILTAEIISEPSGPYIDIMVGTPPKTFRVLLDTGSSNFWLMSSGGPTREGDTRYDPRSSSTYKSMGQQMTKVKYGSDKEYAIFRLVKDTVTVGGKQIANVAIGAATSWAATFLDQTEFAGHGILGLSFPKLAHLKQKTILKVLWESGLIYEPTFGMKSYNPIWNDRRKDKPFLTFGGVATLELSSPFVDLEVISDVHWIVQADSLFVNNKKILGSMLINVDTGTPGIIGNVKDVHALHQQIPHSEEDPDPPAPGQVGFVYPCDSTATMTVTLGGHPIVLTAAQLSIDQLLDDDDDDVVMDSDEDSETSENPDMYNEDDDNTPIMCRSGIVGSVEHQDTWIFGNIFTDTLYLKYTFPSTTQTKAPAQLSFAQLKPPQ